MEANVLFSDDEATINEKAAIEVMKFTISKQNLVKPVSHVQNIVERKNTIAILGYMVINSSTTDNMVSFIGSDMDILVTESISAEVQIGGSIAVPAHMFFDIIRKMPDQEIELTAYNTGNLNINCGSAKFSLSTLSPDQFPIISSGETLCNFNIKSKDLQKLINKTKFAISSEESRYYLNGIYLHVAKNDNDERLLKAVATDLHRLSCSFMALPEGADTMNGIIIPKKTILEISKLIDDYDKEINISVSNSKIIFNFDNIKLVSKLIDGTFPEYEAVIPNNNDKEIKLCPTTFANSLDRVTTVATDRTKGAGVKLIISDQHINISASGESHSQGAENITIESNCTDELEISFNSKYLLDIMNVINGEYVTIALSNETSPVVITDSSDKDSLYIAMPIRV
jgi:DNA polymerase III subunit beta